MKNLTPSGARELAQQLRERTALPEVPESIPSTHMAVTGSASCAMSKGQWGPPQQHFPTSNHFLDFLLGLPVLGISLKCVHKHVTLCSQLLPVMISRLIEAITRVMCYPFPWLTISLNGPNTFPLSIHQPTNTGTVSTFGPL